MSTETRDPLEGLFEKLTPFVLNELLGDVPASLVALGALRRTDPILARRIFIEAFLAPTRILLGDSTSAIAYLEEIESRFYQDDIIAIFRDWETLVMADLLRSFYQQLLETTEGRILDDEGKLTGGGRIFFDCVVRQVRDQLALVVVSCEKLVPLLLVASMTGNEALEEEIAMHRTAHRPGLLASVESWLLVNGYDKDTPELEIQMKRLAAVSDADLVSAQRALLGSFFCPRSVIEERLNSILGVASEPEF
jgi:hypothetical protein